MLSKHFKRFFSFDVEKYGLYQKIFPPNHFRICVVGSDLPGIVVSSLLPRLSTIESYYMKIFANSHFVSLDGKELLATSLKEKDEMSFPILKLINECISIDFDNPIEYLPEINTIRTLDKQYTYDHLILATEPVADVETIAGLKDSLFQPYNKISSLTDLDAAEKTYGILENYKVGKKPSNLIFYNYGGMKPNYFSLLNLVLLYEENLRNFDGTLRESSEFVYITKDSSLAPGKEIFNNYLQKLLEKNKIKVLTCTELIKIEEDSKKIIIKESSGEIKEIPLGILIAEPLYKIPNHISNSPFLDREQKLNFNKNTLINNDYKNVSMIGSSLHPYQTINSFYEQGINIGHNILISMLNEDRKKDKYKLLEYKNYSDYVIYKEKRKIAKLIINGENQEIKEEKLKGYLWQTYGQTEILKRFMQKSKWYGKLKFYHPNIEFNTE